MEVEVGTVELGVLAVVVHDEELLLGAEPALLVVAHGLDGLGVELAVGDGLVGPDGGGEVHHEEASRAGGVGQYVGHVGGGDERGDALGLLGPAGVGALQREGGQLEGVLEEALLGLARDAVEFVEVDEQGVGHGLHDLALVVELQAVQVAPLQLGGQQLAAEGGLVPPLRTYEQGHDAVAELAVVAYPLGHHAEEPVAEPLLPGLEVGLHQGGHVGDVVVSVPRVGVEEEVVVDGVAGGDEGGVEVGHHVLGAGVDACPAGVDGEGVDEAQLRGPPSPVGLLLVEVLGGSAHGVVAEVVALGQVADEAVSVVVALDGWLRSGGLEVRLGAIDVERGGLVGAQRLGVGRDAAAGHQG